MSTNLNHISGAVARAARYVQATWQQAVMGHPVPGMRPVTVNIQLRRLYADNIILGKQINGVNGISRNVIAIKSIARDLEYGKNPWDMKPMLLHGPKARISKAGGARYNIIPFRHGIPTKNPDANFRPMPKDVYKQARQLKATFAKHSMEGGAYQKTLKHGGKLLGTEDKHPAARNPTSNYEHKAGIYEGMSRVANRYGKKTQSKYMTFRVVSENSDPRSWYHPGYEPHNIARAVSDYCRADVEAILREAAAADMTDFGDLSVGMTIEVNI